MRRPDRPALVALTACLTLGVPLFTVACGGSGSTATATSTTAATTRSMRGERYCEVLLVTPTDGVLTAEVYNSWPLDDCPDELWSKLDPAAIAKARGVPAAMLNGPRFWLMDKVEKGDSSAMSQTSFGGIEMYRQANVVIGTPADASTPYLIHAVDRSAIFTFDAGSTVYELHSPDGATYVMQTWSQTVDPSLSESDLAALGSRLRLPAGWTYSSRKLDTPLRIDTTGAPAQVLQDELRNSYSLVVKPSK